MGCGATEAPGLGFFFYLFSTPSCAVSQHSLFGLFYIIKFPVLPPPLPRTRWSALHSTTRPRVCLYTVALVPELLQWGEGGGGQIK